MHREITHCTLCSLHQTRTHAVPGEGSFYAPLMFVGEAPGEQEDLSARPFVGPAGRLLDQLIAHLGLNRKEVYITNVVKCRPPGNRDPLPEEVKACHPYLVAQIALICPKLICILGRHALHTLLKDNLSITTVHGRLFQRDGVFYFPTFHPAAALYKEEVKTDILRDFQKLKEVLRKENLS